MAAQTWDTQLVAQIVSTGVANTTSIGVGSVSVVQSAQLKPPYTIVFGVGAPPSLLTIGAGNQATTIDSLGATTLTFTGPVVGTTIQIETDTTLTGL